MTFSCIDIKAAFPFDQHFICTLNIQPDYTIQKIIEKALSQLYPHFKLDPKDYGIYVVSKDKWLFPQCTLLDYSQYFTRSEISELQLRHKNLIPITISCLQYKAIIYCDPNQPVSVLAIQAAKVFHQKEYENEKASSNSRTTGKISSSYSFTDATSHKRQYLQVSRSAFTDTISSANNSQLTTNNNNDSFFAWGIWSVWHGKRFIPEITPCELLIDLPLQLRREITPETDKIMYNVPLFGRPLREQIMREINSEKKEKRDRKSRKSRRKSFFETTAEKNMDPLYGKTKPNKILRAAAHHQSDSLVDPFEKIGDKLPLIVDLLCDKIEACAKTEGIFRKSGLQTTIDTFIQQVDSMYLSTYSMISSVSSSSLFLDMNNQNDFIPSANNMDYHTLKEKLKSIVNEQNPHETVGILKSFFRLLPEPLIPPIFFSRFVSVSSIPEIEKRLPIYRCIIDSMPATHAAALKRLARCMDVVSTEFDSNKMNISNIVICLFPALLRTKQNDKNMNGIAALNQSKIEMSIGYDLFEKNNVDFLYSHRKRNYTIPSSHAKCIKQLETPDSNVSLNSNYVIVKNDKPGILTIVNDINKQIDVPIDSFQRDFIPVLPFSDWQMVEQKYSVDFQYLPISSDKVSEQVNQAITNQNKRLTKITNNLKSNISELSRILEALNAGEPVELFDIERVIQASNNISHDIY